MNKIVSLVVFSILIAGCRGSAVLKGTDPFDFDYEPVASFENRDANIYLSKILKIFEQSGYEVSANYIFNTIKTFPKKLGKQRWRRNGEKWDLEYQLSVQIINANDDQLYWKLSHNIIGYRSGREPRSFKPGDFEMTEVLINNIYRDLSIVLSEQA